MPRTVDPGTLKTGHGKQAPDEVAPQPGLDGAGLVGPGPNIGQEVAPEGSRASGEATIIAEGLDAHINAPGGSHAASSIQHDGQPGILISNTLEGALDELIATVMQEPPRLGARALDNVFSGIPDWGTLKLQDGHVPVSNINDAGNVFPYYFRAPGPAIDTATFIKEGDDPTTDHVWNTGILAGVEPGTGPGRTFSGGFTRDGNVAPVALLPVMRTARIMERPGAIDAETGVPIRQSVTISGTIFPADRGVLALLHFPPSAIGAAPGDFITDFLAEPLLDRCVAALLMGGGILGDKCSIGPCDDPIVYDGQPGNIFGIGMTGSNYDPFNYPGRAPGQFNLTEIHNGANDLDGTPLTSPWNDLDGDGNQGWQRNRISSVPSAGQVRLGTDPDADPAVVVDFGIPVLGGTGAAYNPAPEQPVAVPGSLTLPLVGNSVIHDINFFKYRLPVLKDYGPVTGLKYTPRGEDPTATRETLRYFDIATPAATTLPDGSTIGASLPTAGLYNGFDEDYWVWQVARYRHTFFMPSRAAAGERDEVGSYWLVHFKTEADFEKLVRDGILPDDVTNGYELYGSSLVDTNHIEVDANIANERATGAVAPPLGPAPAYGHAASSYHPIRSTIFHDPDGKTLLAPAGTLTWTTVASNVIEAAMWVSGVAYFTPRRMDTGAPSFEFTNLTVDAGAGFWTSYRTDDRVIAGTLAVPKPPAIISAMNPTFVGMAPFAYGDDGTGLDLSVAVVTNADPALGLTWDDRFLRKQRIEFPFTHCGSGGFAATSFTDTNGPLDTDPLAVVSPVTITMVGDDADPSFVTDAKIRAYFRRPINHDETIGSPTDIVQPFSAVDGHGQVLTSAPIGAILYHSSRFDAVNKVGKFSNKIITALNFAPFVAVHQTFPELFLAEKDTCERFLDEMYRVAFILGVSTVNAVGIYTNDTDLALSGPGLGAWVGGPVGIPVRIGHTDLGPVPNPGWYTYSWIIEELHTESLDSANLADALQVVGLPDRNPKFDPNATITAPFPSSGLVVYPQKKFDVGYVPAAGHLNQAQPDYTTGGLTSQLTRSFIRTFDVGFINHLPAGTTPPVNMVGNTTVVLRLDGITLSDFAYLAPGPGLLNASGMAIFAKVPGLTTWMDIGRVDGAGPSKQDVALDGAGCLVFDAETYDFTDPQTNLKGCYVKLHVGPVASFFATLPVGAEADYQTPAPADATGETPLMIKVDMLPTAVDYNMEKRAILPGNFEAAAAPAAKPSEVRGLTRITVVHPDESKIVSDADYILVITP